HTRDRAFAFLPAYAPYLEQNPDKERAWLAAVRAARDLSLALEPPADAANFSTDQIRQRVDTIRQRAGVAQVLLRALTGPFATPQIQLLVSQSKSADATVALAEGMETDLATPFLKSEDRVQLWLA